MKAPNFFIVGAPKSGTTAISEYLRVHPDAFVCMPKEPHYFAYDLPNYRFAAEWTDYLRLFDAADGKTAVGEGSVFYLYSREALPAIRKALPDSKLIVMLRNPIELAESMHAQALWTGDETEQDFEAAWRLSEKRKRGLNIPARCHDIKTLLYDEVGRLGSQLERALTVFPREQIRWWFYDDLRSDPGGIYREILSYLGLRDDGRTDFPVVNRRKEAKSRALSLLIHKPPEPLRWMSAGLKRVAGVKEWRWLERIDRMNAADRQRLILSTNLRADTRANYEGDIRLLSQITGRDLSHWLDDGA